MIDPAWLSLSSVQYDLGALSSTVFKRLGQYLWVECEVRMVSDREHNEKTTNDQSLTPTCLQVS